MPCLHSSSVQLDEDLVADADFELTAYAVHVAAGAGAGICVVVRFRVGMHPLSFQTSAGVLADVWTSRGLATASTVTR